MDDAVLTWLLDGDPAITWQVHRDLLDDGAAADSHRARIATEGWGPRLLGHQDPEGTWGGALYSPKWTSTTYSLLLLYRFGLSEHHPAARLGTEVLIDRATYIDGGMTFAKTTGKPEGCITSMVVLLAAAFDVADDRVDGLVEWILDQQRPDGGWNCELESTHSSFHTSITTLEALEERRRRRPDPRLAEAADRGRGFFGDHRLYRSHRSGEVVHDAFTKFSFPPRWHFDVLRGLDHFQAAGAQRDDRLVDAIDLVRSRRRPDGRWTLQNVHRNRTWFTMEQGGKASRWNTLRALRVLRWWG